MVDSHHLLNLKPWSEKPEPRGQLPPLPKLNSAGAAWGKEVALVTRTALSNTCFVKFTLIYIADCVPKQVSSLNFDQLL